VPVKRQPQWGHPPAGAHAVHPRRTHFARRLNMQAICRYNIYLLR
jgi:hypothetical protein